jgi:uncharacterized C2H2 Zn-finger protein
VKAQSLVWTEILAGDSTGEIILTIPPSVGRVPNEGEIIAVEGVLTENEEFLVYRYASATQDKQMQAQAQVQVIQPQSTAPTPQPIPQTIVSQPVQVEHEVKEFKCSTCGKVFKSEQALKMHVKQAHKEDVKQAKLEPKGEVKQEAEPVQETKPATQEVKPPETKPEVRPSEGIPEEAVKLARVAATIQKSYEEFKVYIEGKFPGINIDEVLARAGVKVEDGKLKKV